ncbi:hypothetical protein GCM10028787_31420 [Brachybacterium horti]
MSTATITIQSNGSGTITIDGATSPISAAGVPAAKAVAMRQVKRHAARTAAPVNVQVHEPGGSRHLQVAVDGSITQPAQTPLTPAVTNPPWTQDQSDAADSEPTAGSPAEWAPVLEEIAVSQASVTTMEARGSGVPSPAPSAPIAQAEESQPTAEADPRWADISQQPATQGFRGALNGMGLKLAPTDTELAQRRETLREDIAREERERLADEQLAQEEAVQETRRAARERAAAEKERAERAIIQTSYDESKTVTAANDKGGVGKTTDILCLAAAAGRIRGGDVIAWDANETRGTMGFRALKDRHNRSVVDFLEEAAQDFTTVEGSKRTTLTRYTRGQGDNKFSVLASDESRRKQDQVDGDAFRTVHEIVGRFHSLIFVDTGNNHEVSHFKAALAATDQLVVPVSPGEDGAYAAELMLDLFIGWGYGDLVKNAVVLLHDSATQHGDARAIAAKFENRVRAILPIPFDPILDAGDEIDFDALKPATRAAYQTAAAAISHGLADTQAQR